MSNVINVLADGAAKRLDCPFCGHPLKEITTTNPLGLGRIEMAFCEKCAKNGKLHIMPVWDWHEFITQHDDLERVLNTMGDICKSSYDTLYDLGLGRKDVQDEKDTNDA